ncbi:hypothetical protein KCU73_g8265, partial [Aureobasidium melanogenum]
NSSIPDATGVASAVTSVAQQTTGGGRLGGFPTGSVTSSGIGAAITPGPKGLGALAAVGAAALFAL